MLMPMAAFKRMNDEREKEGLSPLRIPATRPQAQSVNWNPALRPNAASTTSAICFCKMGAHILIAIGKR